MLEYLVFFFQAEDGIRDLVRSRGLGDVYKRQQYNGLTFILQLCATMDRLLARPEHHVDCQKQVEPCLLYTSDAADERSSVDLGGRRIIKKKNKRVKVEV